MSKRNKINLLFLLVLMTVISGIGVQYQKRSIEASLGINRIATTPWHEMVIYYYVIEDNTYEIEHIQLSDQLIIDELRQSFIIYDYSFLPTISYTDANRINLYLKNGEAFVLIVGQRQLLKTSNIICYNKRWGKEGESYGVLIDSNFFVKLKEVIDAQSKKRSTFPNRIETNVDN